MTSALTDPAVLAVWLDDEGVADLDWRARVPDPVIAVMAALHAAGATNRVIGAVFADAAAVHTRRTGRPLGGTWRPTARAVESARFAARRRAASAARRTRPAA